MSYEVRKAVMDRLSGDVGAGSITALVTGKVWDRRIKQDGPGKTPGVFIAVPGDPSKEPIMNPAITIFGPNEVTPPDGPVTQVWSGEPELVNGFLTVHYYAHAGDDGKLLLDAIDKRVRFLLDGWQFVLSTGYTCTVTKLERTQSIDSEEFRGNLEQQRRFVAEWLQM